MLVADAKSGSSHAFEVLVERHARRISCAVRRVTRSREDAEDVAQQSFQKAFVHLLDLSEVVFFNLVDASRNQRRPHVAAKKPQVTRGVNRRVKRERANFKCP